MIESASPIEIAALWRLNILSGYDVAAVCMLWLERNLDQGDVDIATFAGRSDLVREEIAPAFERVLKKLVGRAIERDEAILRALRLHLASALTEGNLTAGVQLIIDRFVGRSDTRLVHHPRRALDRSHEVYAEQNLGLEYVYGRFYAFDDIGHLHRMGRLVIERQLTADLRESVRELHDFLTVMLVD